MSEAEPAERPSVLSVGTLTKVHGVRGEIKLRASAEYVALLRALAEAAAPITLRLPETGDEYEVTFAHVRGADTAPIVAIDGVQGRDEVAEYRGALVCVPRELLPEPEADEYYLADLDGCVVHDAASGDRMGVVTRAESLPANVVLTIELDPAHGGGTILAPLVDDAMPVVDVAGRRIEVDAAFLGIGEDERDS